MTFNYVRGCLYGSGLVREMALRFRNFGEPNNFAVVDGNNNNHYYIQNVNLADDVFLKLQWPLTRKSITRNCNSAITTLE